MAPWLLGALPNQTCTLYPGDCGGDCSKVQDQLIDVQHIYAASGAFAALKADGTVVGKEYDTWGKV